MRTYSFNLTLNSRDLGGYIGENGKEIQYCRIIRSDALRYLSEQDKEFLIKNNVLTQIDLRTEEIAEKYPSSLIDDERFTYKIIPFHEGSLKSLKERTDIPELYMSMIENKQTVYNVFKAIIDAKSNIILNCTAGKDRTGVICIFIMLICGVDLKTIKNDYIISSELIDENLPKVREVIPTFPKFLGFAKPEYFDGFMKLFNEKYKDVNDYLYSIGLNDEDIESIKRRMF